GEEEHRTVKADYRRTNKNKHEGKIAGHQHHTVTIQKMKRRDEERRHHEMKNATKRDKHRFAHAHEEATSSNLHGARVNVGSEDETLEPTSPEARYHISHLQKNFQDITTWLRVNKDDPACKNFLPLLKDHILGRLCCRGYDGDERGFSESDHCTVVFEKNRMYFHSVLQLNYTTYDLRRTQNSVNP
ncbi:uncharacterized protein LAESUDRAFT_658596, partial [Laetiporus sulphureus 93-53]